MRREMDYFYGGETGRFCFYRVPKDLMDEGLSLAAAALYGLMLDRVRLSARNGWADAGGRVFIYCTLQEVQKFLRCGHNRATAVLRELEDFGLIERKRQGLGRPAKIYVRNWFGKAGEYGAGGGGESGAGEAGGVGKAGAGGIGKTGAGGTVGEAGESGAGGAAECGFGRLGEGVVGEAGKTGVGKTGAGETEEDGAGGGGESGAGGEAERAAGRLAERAAGEDGEGGRLAESGAGGDGEDGGPEAGGPECRIRAANHTEIIQTELSKTDPIPLNAPRRPGDPRQDTAAAMDEMRWVRETIRRNIDYEGLVWDYPGDCGIFDGYVELMTEAACAPGGTVRVCGQTLPRDLVRARFLKLEREHILYVRDCLCRSTARIGNIKAYTLAALFNAPATMGQYYAALASRDLAEDGERL